MAARPRPTASIETLDQLDRRILWTLDLDGRMAIREVAKRVKRSQQLVNYRYRRLQKLGFISDAVALINVHLIGLLSFRVYFRLRQIAREQEEQLKAHICGRKDVLWFVELRGSWDYEIVFRVKDYVQFGLAWKDLQSRFGAFYERYDISMTPITYHFRRDYLVREYRREFKPVWFGNAKEVLELSEADREILKEISQNARVPLTALQKKLKIGSSVIKQRLVFMAKTGIIQAYRMQPDRKLLGRRYLKALIQLHYQNPEAERRLYEFCAGHPFVIYLDEVLGSWQFEIEAEVADSSELDDLLKGLRRNFPALIRDYDVVEVAKEFRLDYSPL